MSVSEAAGQLLEIISRKDDGDHKELGVLQPSFLCFPHKEFFLYQFIISAFPNQTSFYNYLHT
jgi:hypothetical protein